MQLIENNERKGPSSRPLTATTTTPVPIEGATWGNVCVRTLGPLPLWHGLLRFKSEHLDEVKEAVKRASVCGSVAIRGYFTMEGATSTYHIVRYARRIGEPVPATETYEQMLNALATHVTLLDDSLGTQQHTLATPNSVEAVFGRQEGYSEKGPSRVYTLEEMRALLPQSYTVKEALIYSASRNGDVYQEPAAVISARDLGFEPLAALAYATKQVRFGLITQGEHSEAAEHRTVEIMPYALEKGAQSRSNPALVSHSLSLHELTEILTGSEPPSVGLTKAYHTGRLEGFPELLALRGVPQDPIWHAEGDCWIHTLWVADEAWGLGKGKPYQRALMLGALCHDLGKALTTTRSTKEKDLGRWIANGHEEAGVAPASDLLRRLGVSEEEQSLVLAITEHHMRPRALFRDLQKGKMDQAGYERAVQRLVRKLPPGSLEPFLAACEADERGRGNLETQNQGPFHWRDAFAKAAEKINQVPTKKDQLLSGRDLIGLGFSPGPQLGPLLEEIEALRADRTLSTREAALQFARDRLSSMPS